MILFPIRAVLSIDMSAEFLMAVGPGAALDRAGLNHGDLDAVVSELQVQAV